jgi:hypothetical protein
MTSEKQHSEQLESEYVKEVGAIAEHCKELEELLLYILDEGLTKEAYKRIGECLKNKA